MDHLRRGIRDVSIRETDPPRILHVQKDEAREFVVKCVVDVRPGPRHGGPIETSSVIVRALIPLVRDGYLTVEEMQLEQRFGVLRDEALRVARDGELYVLQAQRAEAREV